MEAIQLVCEANPVKPRRTRTWKQACSKKIVPLDVLGEFCEAMAELLVTVEISKQMPHQNCQYSLCTRCEEGPTRCSEVMRGAGSVL